jgi:predicted acyltransferase
VARATATQHTNVEQPLLETLAVGAPGITSMTTSSDAVPAPAVLESPRLGSRAPVSTQTTRSIALDAFRGLTVALMLLVNNIALDSATPATLQHAPWGGGITLTDLVFPWFLFAAGTAMPFAFQSARKRGTVGIEWAKRAFSRTVQMFLLGCLVTSAVAHQPILSLGVLQLIALASLVGAVAYPWRTSVRVGIAVALLVAYWALLRFYPVPNVGAGVFEETRNFVRHINEAFLEPWGLRGLPSVVPTAALVVIAGLIGDILRVPLGPTQRFWRVGLIGAGLTIIGWLWSFDLEFNKTVWTPSYILFTAGLGTLVIATFLMLEHFGRAWRTTAFPLIVFGSNALLVYIAPILIKTWILQDWTVSKNTSVQMWVLRSLTDALGQVSGGWAYTILYILACWLGALWLYRHKLFLRV